jgi:hypothetical protein
VPDVLERFEGGDLKAGENARFWLTIRVPDKTPAGEYRGSVTFTCAGGKAVVPVKLRVLPFKLREDPTKIFGIYYHHPLDRAAEAKDDVSREYFRRKADLSTPTWLRTARGTWCYRFGAPLPTRTASSTSSGTRSPRRSRCGGSTALWGRWSWASTAAASMPNT